MSRILLRERIRHDTSSPFALRVTSNRCTQVCIDVGNGYLRPFAYVQKRILFWKILQRIFIFKSLVFHQVIVSGIIHGCSLEFVSNAQEKEENGPECLGAVQALPNCARTCMRVPVRISETKASPYVYRYEYGYGIRISIGIRDAAKPL